MAQHELSGLMQSYTCKSEQIPVQYYKQAGYLYMYCTIYILVLIDVPVYSNSLTCNPTADCLTYKRIDLQGYTQAWSMLQLILHTCLSRDSSPRARTSPLVSIWPNLRIYKGRPSRGKICQMERFA